MTKLEKLREYGFIHILKDKLWGKSFHILEKFGIHILPVHYYSPIPDTRDLRRTFENLYKPSPMHGIDLDVNFQLDFLKELSTYSNHLQALPSFEQMQKSGFGPGYGEVEAHILTAMIYNLQPNLVMEIGSGVSSIYTLSALDKNKKGNLVCIEPYPHKNLIMHKNNRMRLIEKKVQDVPVDEFKKLNENDILFIDSSHVSKLGSDVDFIFLQVLPILEKGVVIHIHDISIPYPCPQDYEYWIFKKHQFWNENSLVQAFLCFNKAFKIVLSTAYLHYYHTKELKQSMEIYNPKIHSPSSLWLRKVC